MCPGNFAHVFKNKVPALLARKSRGPRVRERALADAREHVNVLMQELVLNRAELRARDTRIADLESQLEEHRRQLATVIARAISKSRATAAMPRPRLVRKPKPLARRVRAPKKPARRLARKRRRT
jgi:hypothetical protein